MKKIVNVIILIILFFFICFFNFDVKADDEKEMTLGQQFNSTFVDGESETINFTLEKAGKVTITITTQSDVLEGSFTYGLYKKFGMTSWDSLNGKFSVTLDQYLERGNYSCGFSCSGNGTYTIDSQFVEVEESFPETIDGGDNTIATANAINLNEKYHGIIMGDEKDVYKFTIPKTMDISVSTSFKGISGWFLYTIYDENANDIIYEDLRHFDRCYGQPVCNEDESVDYERSYTLGAGVYYFALKAADIDFGGPYSFSIGDVKVSSIEVDQTSVSLIKGNSATINVDVLPNNATNKNYSSVSNNPDVATVNGNVITAVGSGNAKVTFTTEDGSFTKVVDVKVKDPKTIYWVVDGTKCTSKSASCKLILSSSAITGEHYASGTITETIGWEDYIDSITSIQIGKENDLIKICDDVQLFVGLSRVTSIDLSYLDTSELTKTSFMFNGLSGVKKLDVSKLNTSKVTNMEQMFDGNLQSLEELVINGIDTSKVTNMSRMFSYMPRLKKLDISMLNTSRVTNMQGMFYKLYSLQKLNLSGIDTSQVTNMSDMFSELSGLRELDVSSLNTSNVTNMYGMFNNLGLIIDLDLTNFDTRKVENMADMFYGDAALEFINLTSFDTSKVTIMREMFANDYNLSVITVSNKWKINENVDCTNMFYEDYSLIGEYGTKYDSDKVDERYAIIDTEKDVGYLWSKVPRPVYYYIENWNTCSNNNSCVLKISSKKRQDNNDNNTVYGKTYFQIPWINELTFLSDVIVGGPDDIVKPMSTKDWFNGLNVHVIDLTYLDTSEVVNMDRMFTGDNLKIVVVSDRWDTSNVQSSNNMFWHCYNIIGMNGTTYDDSKVDKEYARLDGTQKGYFWNKTNQTNKNIERIRYEEAEIYDTNKIRVRYAKDPINAWTKEIKELSSMNSSIEYKGIKYISSDGKEVKYYEDWTYVDMYFIFSEEGYLDLLYRDDDSYYPIDNVQIVNVDLNAIFYTEPKDPIYGVLGPYMSDYIKIKKLEYVDDNHVKIYLNQNNIDILVGIKTYSNSYEYIYRKGRTDSNGIAIIESNIGGEYHVMKYSDNGSDWSPWSTAEPYNHFDPECYLHSPIITITKGANNSLTINIDKQKVDKYIISRSTDNKKWKKIAETANTTYTDTGLTYGTTYYYRVEAHNSYYGLSDISNVVKMKVVPDKVNIRVTGVGQKNIKIAWDKVPVTGYEVYMNNKKVATISKSGTLSYNKTKLSTNKTYSFKVRAYKTVKGKKIYGAFSDSISALTAPATPKLSSVGLKDYNALNVNFKSVGGATRYEIVRSTSKKGTYTKVGEMVTSGTYVDNNLNTGTTYYYKVRACNKNNNCGAYSSIVSKKVVPLKPGNVTKTLDYYSINLNWNAVNGADGYEIQRSTYKNKKYKTIATVTAPTFNNTKLSSNKTYYYKIRAYRLVNGKKVFGSYTGVITAKTKKLSTNQKKALDKAKSYLKTLSFSREGLIDQLEYHKFSHSDAEFAVKYCGANWNDQSVKKAKSYLKVKAFSYEGLIDQLEFDKFTHEQAVYGADHCGANWNEQALKSAQSYLKLFDFTSERLRSQLEYEKFTTDQINYALSALGM